MRAWTHFLAFMEWADDIGSRPAAWSYVPVQSSSRSLRVLYDLSSWKVHLVNHNHNNIFFNIYISVSDSMSKQTRLPTKPPPKEDKTKNNTSKGKDRAFKSEDPHAILCPEKRKNERETVEEKEETAGNQPYKR